MNPPHRTLIPARTMSLAGAICSICLFLLFAHASASAQENGVPMPNRPQLPQTSPQNWMLPQFKMERAVSIYNTWKLSRKKIADLPRNSTVRALGKLSVVYQPDEISLTASMSKLGLNSGDVIYRPPSKAKASLISGSTAAGTRNTTAASSWNPTATAALKIAPRA